MIKTEKKLPLKNLWQNGLCIGCGACIAICPERIIRLDFSRKEAIYKAEIQSGGDKICTGCGLCFRVCPIVENCAEPKEKISSNKTDLSEIADWVIGPYKNIYTGFAADSNLRYMCSSGGVATAILTYLLKTNRIDGALIASPIEGNAISHKISFVKKFEDIINNKGTVYTQIDYTRTWEVLQENKIRLAIVGLPCQLKAVNQFMAAKKLDTSKVFKIGLFCSGMSKQSVLQFLCKRKKISPDKVLSISYRSGGWPGRKMIVTIPDPVDPSSTKEVVLFERDASLFQKYLYSFCFSGPFYLKGCLVCKDQTAECADISLGDAWLPRFTSSDSTGTNIIILRTAHAQEYIELAVNDSVVCLQGAQSEDVLNSQGGLVGKKLGMWGKHLNNSFLSAPELVICERYLSQYVPGKIVLLQRRIFNWLTEHLPSPFAFSCFVILKFSFSVYVKSIKKLETLFRGEE